MAITKMQPNHAMCYQQPIVAVVGLGYVGLSLAVEFGKKFETSGFDLSEAKITHYKHYCDPTGEVSTEDLKAATRLSVSTNPVRSTRSRRPRRPLVGQVGAIAPTWRA